MGGAARGQAEREGCDALTSTRIWIKICGPDGNRFFKRSPSNGKGAQKVPDRAVYKSRAAEFLDGLFGGDPDELRVSYERAADNLARIRREGIAETAERLVQTHSLPGDIGVDHFERYWLSESGPMADKHVARVLRCGYEEAIRIARNRDNPLPIQTLWATGASEEFEVHICEGEGQVTVTWLIPIAREYGSKDAKSTSWVVRVGRDGDDPGVIVLDRGDPPVVAVQTSGPPSSSGD
jgi:hypothetical protein